MKKQNNQANNFGSVKINQINKQNPSNNMTQSNVKSE